MIERENESKVVVALGIAMITAFQTRNPQVDMI